jgi:hypothetical protein
MRTCVWNTTLLRPLTRRTWIVLGAALALILALILWQLSVPAANASEITAVAVTAALESGWIEQLTNSLTIYKANYPASDFGVYQKRLGDVRAALDRGDRKAVKVEMTAYFKMLDKRAGGISEVAADELSNYAQMVTPVQEYGISIPRSGAGQ